jgi:predicted PhzF superfamily epimerase YddE/YHI9
LTRGAARPPARPCAGGGVGDEGHAFLSRFFAPWAGIDEDPVTGSAHSVLGPLWGERLGRRSMRARQCSARGGELLVEVKGGRVRVSGHAALVVAGRLLLPSSLLSRTPLPPPPPG